LTDKPLTRRCTRTAIPLHSIVAGDVRRSPALRSGERGRGSGIRLSARRWANKRLEQRSAATLEDTGFIGFGSITKEEKCAN